MAVLALLAVPTSCNELATDPEDPDMWDYPIVDWYPVNVFVRVQDKKGNDLLDPNRSGNYADGTTLTFDGTTYTVRELETGEYWNDIPTKMYLARMKGLRLVHDSLYVDGAKHLCYFLAFGEIDGAKDYDEDLTIQWPDGKKDVIHYKCWNHHITKQKDGSWDIGCERTWKLNKKAADNPFILVK